MDLVWTPGLLVVAVVVAQAVVAVRDAGRDVAAPYRLVVELPEPGPDAWVVGGPSRFGALGGGLRARLTVTADWIGVRQRTLFRGTRCYLAARRDVERVVVVLWPPNIGAGIGVRGWDRTSGLAVYGTNRRRAEAELDRLGWPYERRRGRLFKPFA